MAICLECNCADTQHQIESPSKRFELKNGIRKEVCSGFNVIPKDFYKNQIEQRLEIPQKVIA